ncbi:MAG: (4Fe-4S)-binding protein [Clostridiales Family XIII bacterium]|nr:(4Fe-4S)-binding protein [Clostridiales Family XIII bacterium]
MFVLTAQEVKQAARGFGADLAGIGSIDRWVGAPAENHPAAILPNAKSVICIGFRVHRGSYRGIEEGTYYSGYTLLGFSEVNNHVAPFVQRQLASFIEDRGYETSAYLHNSSWLGLESGRAAKNPDGTDKPRPEVFLNFRIGAMLCGVGEIGLSRVLLTPEFGPAQRLFLLVTEAPLEPDPVVTGICDRCGECIRKCPAKALKDEPGDCLDIPGVATVRRCAFDFAKCGLVHSGGALSPFAPEEVRAYARNIIDGTDTHTADGQPRPGREEIDQNVGQKVPYVQNADHFFRSPAGLCAGESCMRACLAHLEKRGKLTHKFVHPFR